MALFDFFRRKNLQQKIHQPDEEYLTTEAFPFQKGVKERYLRIPKHMQKDSTNYLWMATRARNRAKEALNNQQYDLAWKLEHERIQHYTHQALKRGYSEKKSRFLISIVYLSLSNILQKEAKYTQALAFHLYAIQFRGHLNDLLRVNIHSICQAGNLTHLNTHIEEFLNNHVDPDKVDHADLLFCQSEVNRWQLQNPFHSDNIQEMIHHYAR